MLNINLDAPVIRADFIEIDKRLQEKELLRNKKIYITGASGMIASYLTGYLIWLNEQSNFNMQIYAGIRNQEKAVARFGNYVDREYFHLINQDVIIPIQYEYGFDFIVHAASLASPQYYGIFPVEAMLPNIIGTYNLLEYAKKHKVEDFLFFSSGSTYGSIFGTEKITEDSIGTLNYLNPGNFYGESKRCGEALCAAYFREYGVNVKSARIYHTYGPTMDIGKDTRVFTEFVNNIIHNENIILKSSGTAKRAFSYITDTVIGLIKILLVGDSGEAYNVGNPDEYLSINDLAQELVNLFPERSLKVEYMERTDFGYSASPEVQTSTISVDKLKSLGWECRIGTREGFMRTIKGIEYQLKK